MKVLKNAEERGKERGRVSNTGDGEKEDRYNKRIERKGRKGG